MLIELISTESKAPTKREQQKAIRADGTNPERLIEVPKGYEYFPLNLAPGEDTVCVAHPKVLGNARLAGAVLTAIDRMGARLKFPNETAISVTDPETRRDIMARIVSTPWDELQAKEPRGRGRPSPKGRRAPTEAERAELMPYWTDTARYKPHVVIALAKGMLGWTPKRHNLNDWLGPRSKK